MQRAIGVAAALVAAGWSVSASSEDRLCTARNAEPVTVAMIAERPADFQGECVVVEGIVSGRRLYHDAAALYARERRLNDPASSGVIIGLDHADMLASPARMRIVGRVDDCGDRGRRLQRAAGPQDIIMLTGYCHYYRGPVLSSLVAEPVGGASVSRLRAGSAPARLGNLSHLAEGPLRARFMAVAEQLAAALSRSDEAGLRQMLTPGAGGARAGAELDAMVQQLSGADLPFLNRAQAAPAIEIFGWREPLWADAGWRAETATAPATAVAILCYAAPADAPGIWPIADRDAIFASGRPYACVRAELAHDGRTIIEADDGEYALPEP